mmetsp:Transcript_10121/g.14997  ORF Transcript_10121/g.14997 Transcript_10121/m.14997 type:complete len:222 (-) Transcript_10121:245-910(-)
MASVEMCLFTIVFSLAAWILSAIAAFGCFFLEGQVDGSNTNVGVGFLGVSGWKSGTFNNNGTRCHPFGNPSGSIIELPLDPRDSAWTAAYAFAVIAFSLGFIAVVFSFCSAADAAKFGSKGDSCLLVLLFFIVPCQGLSFLVLSSGLIGDYKAVGIDLGLGFGAGTSIAATIVWLFAAISSAVMARQEHKYEGDAVDEVEEAYTEPLLSEGVGNVTRTSVI